MLACCAQHEHCLLDCLALLPVMHAVQICTHCFNQQPPVSSSDMTMGLILVYTYRLYLECLQADSVTIACIP